MKPFNLKEYQAGRKVVTRTGLPVRILCTDRKTKLDNPLPIVGMINVDDAEVMIYTDATGRFSRGAGADLYSGFKR